MTGNERWTYKFLLNIERWVEWGPGEISYELKQFLCRLSVEKYMLRHVWKRWLSWTHHDAVGVEGGPKDEKSRFEERKCSQQDAEKWEYNELHSRRYNGERKWKTGHNQLRTVTNKADKKARIGGYTSPLLLRVKLIEIASKKCGERSSSAVFIVLWEGFLMGWNEI